MTPSALSLLRSLRPAAEPGLAAVFGIAAVLGVASDALSIPAVILASIALAVSRIRPTISAVLIVVAGALASWGANTGSMRGLPAVAIASALAIGVARVFTSDRLRWWMLGAAIVAGVEMTLASSRAAVALGLLTLVFYVGAWSIGTAIVEARRRIEALREAAEVGRRLEHSEQELTLSDERTRIAREMHDVVAHSLAVILAQAQGARALETRRPAAMAEALDAIADAARTALLDVRGVIDGMVDGVPPPQPGLAGIGELLERVRSAGVEVRAVAAGEPQELGPGQQAAVYRIVQEGTTNAIRHRGRGSGIDLVLDWRGPGLSIQLVSSGAGDAEPAHGAENLRGAGRGIPGMKERARTAGGWLAAGADESGVHRITAFIPYRHVDAPVPG